MPAVRNRGGFPKGVGGGGGRRAPRELSTWPSVIGKGGRDRTWEKFHRTDSVRSCIVRKEGKVGRSFGEGEGGGEKGWRGIARVRESCEWVSSEKTVS